MASLRERVHRAVLDPEQPGSLAARARARRWAALQQRFPSLGAMRVLDLGGTVANWRTAPVRPAELVILNVAADEDHSTGTGARVVIGDACAPPAAVLKDAFDLVYSNSVIEHVGGAARRQQFAATVHAAAPAHWIQTPNRNFPIEPHWLFPGFQFLPRRTRAAISRRWPLGHFADHPADAAHADVAGVELVSRAELTRLFPGSAILPERAAGLVKSWIAVRPANVAV